MKKMIVMLVAALFLAGGGAFAATKIAYVDLQKALNTTAAGAKAKEEVNALMAKYKADFDIKRGEFLKMKGEYEGQAPLLAADARKAKEAELQKAVAELQQFEANAQKEVRQLDSSYTKRILDELKEILQEIGKKGSYTIILEKNEGGVFYVDSQVKDLTDELIETHNKAQK